MKLVLDSSVFISYLNENDIFFDSTTAFIDYLVEKQEIITIPVIVFLEVANVLTRNNRDFKEEHMLSVFSKYEMIDINLHFARFLLPLFKNFHLKTSDAIILGSTILNEAILITWDEKFKKEAKKLIDVQTPKTFMSLLEQAPS